MSASARLTFDQSREQVEGMMERGTAFSHVEDAIDTAQLSTEHKAALWLLAWSLRDHVQQRQDARLMLAAAAAAAAADGEGRNPRARRRYPRSVARGMERRSTSAAT